MNTDLIAMAERLEQEARLLRQLAAAEASVVRIPQLRTLRLRILPPHTLLAIAKRLFREVRVPLRRGRRCDLAALAATAVLREGYLYTWQRIGVAQNVDYSTAIGHYKRFQELVKLDVAIAATYATLLNELHEPVLSSPCATAEAVHG